MGSSLEPWLGQLLLVPYDFVPQFWHKADGAALPTSYKGGALFSLLGTRFGGNGKTDFRLPDLKGKEPLEGLHYIIATDGWFPERRKVNGNVPFVSETLLLPYVFNMGGWLECDGQMLDGHRPENRALYDVIGTTFGGKSQADFALPKIDALIHDLNYSIAVEGIFPSPNEPAREGFLGGLLLAPKVALPSHWVRCEGQALKISNNVALYSLIGTKFGGDGQTDFKLPDLRGNELIANYFYSIATKGPIPSPA